MIKAIAQVENKLSKAQIEILDSFEGTVMMNAHAEHPHQADPGHKGH